MTSEHNDWDELRQRLIGLGEQSSRKSYYPELRKKLAQLRESEERFAGIFNSVSDAIFVHDAVTGGIIDINQRVCEMYGMTREEALGMQLGPTSDDDDAFTQQQALRRLQLTAAGEPQNFEWQARHREGHPFWVEVSMRRARIGGRDCIVASVRNIEARKQTEQERLALERKLLHVQKLESLGVMAGGIAHDFNNLLTAIVGNAELVRLRSAANSPILINIDRIQQAAHSAADLAKQMLAYSGKGKFVIEVIDMNLLIEEMLNILKVSIPKQIELHLELCRPLPGVRGDISQLRQVLMNLVINASEAIGENPGQIRVQTDIVQFEDDDTEHLWYDEMVDGGQYIYLEVADNGCGMDRPTLQKLYDPFFTTKFSGRGLGMSAVLGIIRGHKGLIKVYSEPGQGTTFKVLLPAGGSREVTPSQNGVDDSWQGGGKILLVDDEAQIRETAADMLAVMGFEVVTAADGVEALEQFDHHPDLRCVILDLTMPRMGGEQCYYEIRRRYPEVRVLMSSGYNEQEITRRFTGQGLIGFIRKPYRLSVLRQMLRRFD